MKFRIDGADRETGKDSSITLEAASEAEAVKSAGRTLLISSVKDVTPAPLPYQTPIREVELPQDPPPPAGRSTLRPQTPEFWLLYLVGALSNAFGIITCTVCIALLNRSTYYTDRFQSDNAIGASANALERFWAQSPHVGEVSGLAVGFTMIVFGLLVLILRAIYRIEHRVWHVMATG